MKRAAALLLALAVLAGCSSKPPEISRVYARVIYARDARGAVSQSLGVFLVATDPDGLENLSAFYVINDDAELFWKVDSSSWVSSTAEGETWIGTSSLAMPGAVPVPPGRYRVVLQDVGGQTVEEPFTLPARTRAPAGASYPSATVSNGVIKVNGAYPSYEIWAYGGDGKFAAAFPLAGRSPSLEQATITGSSPGLAPGFTFRVFAWDERGGYGVLSPSYSVGTLPAR